MKQVWKDIAARILEGDRDEEDLGAQGVSAVVVADEDVRVGDLIHVGRGHRVDRVTDHVHPELGAYRVARADEPEGEWGIALYPGTHPHLLVSR